MSESIPSIVDHNVVHVETPMGVSEITPNMTAIRYMAHDRAEERGIHLPNETIDQLELLQTPVALCHHIRPAEDSNLPAPLRTALTGFSFVHKFAPFRKFVIGSCVDPAWFRRLRLPLRS